MTSRRVFVHICYKTIIKLTIGWKIALSKIWYWMNTCDSDMTISFSFINNFHDFLRTCNETFSGALNKSASILVFMDWQIDFRNCLEWKKRIFNSFTNIRSVKIIITQYHRVSHEFCPYISRNKKPMDRNKTRKTN